MEASGGGNGPMSYSWADVEVPEVSFILHRVRVHVCVQSVILVYTW